MLQELGLAPHLAIAEQPGAAQFPIAPATSIIAREGMKEEKKEGRNGGGEREKQRSLDLLWP
jgi:hypothetical protein